MISGKNLADIRKSKKITQQELSEISGVNYNTLRKIESGQTKNPKEEYIKKIAEALRVDYEFIKNETKPNAQTKPDIHGSTTLPLQQLPPDRFEDLVVWILKYHRNYDFSTVEKYAGRGDKQRDVIAKKIKNGKTSEKFTLFQAKRYEKINFSTFEAELKSIKNHFFKSDDVITPIESIVFCVSSPVSPTIKDKVKEYAKKEYLPDPILWDSGQINILSKEPSILNEFFGGHIGEMSKELKKGLNLQKKNESLLKDIDSKIFAFSAVDDAEMQKARRLINQGDHKEAKEILLKLEKKVENSNDNERLKKLYNNLGLCYSKNINDQDIEKGLKYLQKALDLDNNFIIPKKNIIEIIVNNAIEDKYEKALELSKEIYENNQDDPENLSLYIFSLNANKKIKEATELIEGDKNIEEMVLKNESLCTAIVLIYFNPESKDDMKKASSYIDMGLKTFPESVNLNKLKGNILMYEANQKGKGFLGDDAIPHFKDINLVKQALYYFEKTEKLMDSGKWPERMTNQVKLYVYNTRALLHQGKKEELLKLKLKEKEISQELLTSDEERDKYLVDIYLKLFRKEFLEAYNLTLVFLEKYNCGYEEIKMICRNFIQHASPEFAIKIIKPRKDEAKDKEDLEYWSLLSRCYVLIGDKNSALSAINEAKSFFATKDKEYNEALSLYGALAARYKDNSESDRLVKSMFELQDKMPEEKIMVPVKALEDDGSLSDEIKDFFIKAKKDFEMKRDLFKTSPLPIYFLMLDRMFNRSFPEVVSLPSENFDFDFILPYNALDKNFIEKQNKLFHSNTDFVLDYSSLLNFARTGQLGLFSSLNKKIKVSEHLLYAVQFDLLISEDVNLREAWDFLRSDEVEIIQHYEADKNSLPDKMKDFFESKMKCLWLSQEIDYCVKNNAVLLTDDLRIWHYMYSKEVNGKALNSFVFFQEALNQGIIDKKQYSLILGDVADLFYHFIPFNGEDMLNIVLDDEMKIRGKNVAFLNIKIKDDEFKISRRMYHLLNQSKLPGSEMGSFLVVSFDFLKRLMKLSVLEEDKINWVLFLTNYFSDIIMKDDSDVALKKYFIQFVADIWVLLVRAIPKKINSDILDKAKEIKNNDLKIGIIKSLSKL